MLLRKTWQTAVATKRFCSSATTATALQILDHLNSTQDQLETPAKPACDKFGRYYATGRRKTSVARVWIKEGCGEFIVNDKPLTVYFQTISREILMQSFLFSKTAGFFDVWCTVKGGGISGQAGAIRLGISRALQKYDGTLRPSLKKGMVNIFFCWLIEVTISIQLVC